MQDNLEGLKNFKGEERDKEKEYAFLLYPESCAPDWIGIIKQLQQPFFVILHDRDVEPDGSPKKPHYHVMILFDNSRARSTARRVNLMCGGNGHFEQILSRRGYVRYLCHLDDPDKYQYAPEAVRAFCGADYSKESMSVMQRKNLDNDMFCDIVKFCKDNHVIAYYQLVDYCMEHKREWIPCLRGRNGQAVVNYIKSYYWFINRNGG